MLRLVMAGGRATEALQPGPSGAGAVGVGTRTLSESGTAGGWQRQQVRLGAEVGRGVEGGLKVQCRTTACKAQQLSYSSSCAIQS